MLVQNFHDESDERTRMKRTKKSAETPTANNTKSRPVNEKKTHPQHVPHLQREKKQQLIHMYTLTQTHIERE